MMDNVLLTILNMSLTGAFVIAAICLARLPLRKAPKVISYAMWAVAGFRLIFPFSFESAISLVPFASAQVTQGAITASAATVSAATASAATASAATASAATTSAATASAANASAAAGLGAVPAQLWLTIGASIWLAGVVVLIAHGLVSVHVLKRKMRGAVCVVANVYEAENIRTPFVLGFFPPSIYIPSGLTEQERKYVIMHENTHILRRDHIIKFFSYFILCLHWFNPLAWVAFKQMGADMEMSCDESVLKSTGKDAKKVYSRSLMKMATKERCLSCGMIAFGGRGVKKRVKNILRLRRYPRVVVIAALVLSTFFSIGLSVDRAAGIVAAGQPGVNTGYYGESCADERSSPEGQHTGSPYKTMKLSAKETKSYSFGKILSGDRNGELLPYDRHYIGMEARGDELTFRYVELD